jgi:hypothetical protein
MWTQCNRHFYPWKGTAFQYCVPKDEKRYSISLTLLNKWIFRAGGHSVSKWRISVLSFKRVHYVITSSRCQQIGKTVAYDEGQLSELYWRDVTAPRWHGEDRLWEAVPWAVIQPSTEFRGVTPDARRPVRSPALQTATPLPWIRTNCNKWAPFIICF